MGWEQPGVAFDGLIDRKVKQWILPFANIADFLANHEQWHSRWMQARICRSRLLCLEEHGFYVMLLKRMATRVMGSPGCPDRFTSKIAQQTLTMAHVCGGHLKKELGVGGTFAVKSTPPYFHVGFQPVRSIVDLEYPFQDDWIVIKYPKWVVLPTDPNPKHTEILVIFCLCCFRMEFACLRSRTPIVNLDIMCHVVFAGLGAIGTLFFS